MGTADGRLRAVHAAGAGHLSDLPALLHGRCCCGSAEMTNLALGVDIGGTKIAVGLIEASGHVEHRVEVPTPAQEGADAIVAAVLAAARVVMVGQSIVACGVGTAGVVSRAGEIVSATDLL